jgi:prepilin-type N-terminal cleavage/methylation domain-containing protein/prepilin-type processing-associated H-X9-DG protein
MCGPNRRTGFTLVELLVVIGILATLMGMLLPAVQGARESGRRNNCMNNMSQLGKAVFTFDSARGHIPGWRNPTVLTTVAGGVTPGWPVMLLPQIDRRDLFRLWESGANPRSYIDLFVCPSSAPDLIASTGTSDFMSFGGNCGSGGNTAAGDGVMFDSTLTGGRISLDYVSAGDGTATTMLFSERRNPEAFSWGVAPAAAAAMGFTHSAGTNRVFNLTPFNATTPSSAHPNGIVMTFCDGHTMFLSDAMIGNVYTQLMTSNSVESNQPALAPLNERDLKVR